MKRLDLTSIGTLRAHFLTTAGVDSRVQALAVTGKADQAGSVTVAEGGSTIGRLVQK